MAANLHSNMDRLKLTNMELALEMKKNLHSNMDRLKPLYAPREVTPVNYLHSNMDRLKPAICSAVIRLRSIYIPIWID